MIRPGTLDDAPAAAQLLAAVYPHDFLSGRSLRHFWASVPARARRRTWAAESGGELVGWAAAGLSFVTAEEGSASARASVHPAHRRRGIGRALWNEVETHLEALGARHVVADGADDETARRFMAERGFEVAAVDRLSGLDLRTLEPPPAPPPDVELRPFAAFDDPRAIFDLHVEASRDVPFDQPFDDIRFEEWSESFWRHPDLDRDASLVALVDGEPASFTHMLTDLETGRTLSGMTGTARRFRGRGLALLVKHHALTRVAAQGITLAITSNSEANRAMLAVNERLGYRPLATTATFSRRS